MKVQVLAAPEGSTSGTFGSLFARQLSRLHTYVELITDESRDPRSVEVITAGASDSPDKTTPLWWGICFTSFGNFEIIQTSRNAVVEASSASVSLLRADTPTPQPAVLPGQNVQVLVPDRQQEEALVVQTAWQALTKEQKMGVRIKWSTPEPTGLFSKALRLLVQHFADKLQITRRRNKHRNTGVTVIGDFDPLTRLDLSIKSLCLGRPVILLQPKSTVESIWGNPLGVISCAVSAHSIAYSILQCLQDTPPREDLIATGRALLSKTEQVGQEDLPRDLALAYLNRGLASAHKCRACGALVEWQPTMKAMTRDTLRFSLATQWGIEINEELQAEPGIIQKFDCDVCGSSTFNALQGTTSFYNVCHATPGYQREDTWDYIQIADEIMQMGAREVLDFGSGVPKLLDLLPPDSISLSLLDIDSDVLELSDLTSRGVKVLTDWDDETLAGTFDAVAICHVLEHLDNPDQTLRSIHSALKPGGLLGITVPDAAWPSSQFSALEWPPHHVTCFSEQGLLEITRRSGFVWPRVVRPPGTAGSSFDMLLITYKPERNCDSG